MQKEIVYTVYQINHCCHTYRNNTYIYYIEITKSDTEFPLKTKFEAYTGMPMGYGTIASNGATHG